MFETGLIIAYMRIATISALTVLIASEPILASFENDLVSNESSSSASSDSQESPSRPIVLSPGRSYELSLPSTKVSVTVTNGAVIKASDFGATLRLTGRKIGFTHLIVGELKFDVHVVSSSDASLWSALKATLRGRRGLDLRIDAGTGSGPKTIAVTGRLLRLDDWLALAKAAEGATSSWRMAAKIDPIVLPSAETLFRSRVEQALLPGLTLSFDPSPTAIIPTEPIELSERVSSLLKPFGFRIEKSSSALNLEPLVRVRIVVAEFRKKMRSALGLQWPSSVEAQLLPAPAIPSEGGLKIGVNALEENGLGRILAEPTLLCRSGKEASFLAGGEFPIKIVNLKQKDVIWKKYGVVLKIRPRADGAGRMSIGIETEVSMIDPSHTVDGVPGLLTNRIDTHFDLTSSRTIALSGLIKKEWSEASQGLPALSNLPILGSLFSSREYRDNRTELIIFVTPEVVRPDQEEQ
jgi:pilus assembly protein CpaC